jgi:hypothetical protein
MFARLRPATREVLQRVAVAASSFDTDEFVALSGLAETEAFGHLDDALAARIVEPASAGYRFRHCLIRDALTSDVPEHRRRQVHQDTARRLVELGTSPVRIGHHFLAAGAGADAVPHLVRAAETESAVGAYRDALALVDKIRPHATGPCRTRALSLRADLLTAIGDPMAGSAYREALGGAGPADARRLRARLRTARSWRATSPRPRPLWTNLAPTAAPTTPTSSWPGASSRSSPRLRRRPGRGGAGAAADPRG